VDSFPYGNVVILETPGELLPAELRELIDLEDGESLYHLYAHMLEPPLVELGQPVGLCDLIGYAGASGRTEAPHLHFETRIGLAGGRFPVMNAFVDGVTEEERRYYKLWRVSMQYAHFDPMILMGYDIEE
jgi:murein DD-endopeptidase MepM/ murein hydrolase activator NlpD